MSHSYRADTDGSAFDFRHIEAELVRDYSDPLFVIEAIEELHEAQATKPDSNLYLHIHTSDEGSAWNLPGKFGAFEGEAKQLIAEAATMGAHLAGVGFHVDSQCENIQNWPIGIRAARETFEQMNAGDLNYVHDHGAYSAAYSNNSNGFPIPNPVVVNTD